ncbi:MAG: chondroitinase-B domain-containing protein [Armatimonadota bacterium]
MSRLTAVIVIALLLLYGGACYAEPGDLPGSHQRDVIGGAFTYPVLTDAEVDLYITETRAKISATDGPVHFRYPGITGLNVDSQPVSGTIVTPGLLRVELPAGPHVVEVVTDGSGADTIPTSSSEGLPASADDLEAAVEGASPGDEIVVQDGIYREFRARLSAEGTAQEPIVVRPETPGSVVFHGQSRMTVTGQFVVLRGFRFEECYPAGIVQLENANDCRVTQCHFTRCGNPSSTFSHILRVSMGCDRNRVDHCFFTGSKSMSLGQVITLEGEVGRDNRYDHNIFRDIFRYSSNGQENIQIGQNQRERGHLEPRAVIEYNLFNYAWGDGEIISNKSSRNIIQHNLAAHCIRSGVTLRGGNEVRVDGNVLVNNAIGLRVMGKRHTIVNNLFLDQLGSAIRLETGRLNSRLNIETEGTTIANNTIIDCDSGIVGMEPTDERPHKPADNRFLNNLITGSTGTLLQTEYFDNSTVGHNLLYATGQAIPGEAGTDGLTADPQLTGEGYDVHAAADSPAVEAAMPLDCVPDDRWSRLRPHGDAPDIGACEVGALSPEEPVELPQIPPEPVFNVALYMGEPVLNSGESADMELADETTVMDTQLPAECVVAWDHHPQAYDATSTVTLTDADGDGYTVRWRGTDDEGMPHGKLELLRAPSGEILTEGSDVVMSWRDFPRDQWNDADPSERPQPPDSRWWRFTLMKMQDRLLVFLENQHASGMQVPVLSWNEHDPAAAFEGPVSVSISQDGTGLWQGIYACEYEYAADTPPGRPANLTAEAYGGGRVQLTWEATRARRSGWTYQIYRGTSEEFETTETTRIASDVFGSGYNDFSVEASTRYFYRVRAMNIAGVSGEMAAVGVETQQGGPLYRYIPAREATNLQPPMTVVEEPFEGYSYLTASGAAGASRDGPPEDGMAQIHLGDLEEGEYAIWGLLWAPSKSADSFWVSFSQTDEKSFSAWSTGVHPHWEWGPCEKNFKVAGGDYIISLKHREPTTRLAAILVTSDMSFSPSGQ